MYGHPQHTAQNSRQERALLLGSGELGKELTIEFLRLGVDVIACDRYDHAPAMQVTQKKEVFDMLDATQLKTVVRKHQPTLIVPEVEAIATSALIELEHEGYRVVPTARAADITMNREKLRTIAHEVLNLPTVPFTFASSLDELKQKLSHWTYPLVIKPIMSSSGKGQSIVSSPSGLEQAWLTASEKGRGQEQRVIVEEFVTFTSEVTLLTLKTSDNNTLFCDPIGHEQRQGDYYRSWQPHTLTDVQWQKACTIAKTVCDYLGGTGIFGVELFLLPSGDVLFNEVSPRPHDTGMVTMITQPWSQFALHVRAILGWPLTHIKRHTAGVSRALKATQEAQSAHFHAIPTAMQDPNLDLRLFAKPTASMGRRLGVLLASGDDTTRAEQTLQNAQQYLQCQYHKDLSANELARKHG